MFAIIRKLVLWENTNNEAVLEEARAETRKSRCETWNQRRAKSRMSRYAISHSLTGRVSHSLATVDPRQAASVVLHHPECVPCAQRIRSWIAWGPRYRSPSRLLESLGRRLVDLVHSGLGVDRGRGDTGVTQELLNL